MAALDRGVSDLVAKGVIAAAVGVLGYFANASVERVRELEREAAESKERHHRLELSMRSEMLSRADFREWIARWESTINNHRDRK